MPRHRLIQTGAPEEVNELVVILEKEFIGIAGASASTRSGFERKDDINIALELVAIAHLQYEGAPDPDHYCNMGVDCALDYFLGD